MAISACTLVLLTATAGAATPPLSATHATPGAAYSGWAYTRTSGATTALWRWRADGWDAVTLPTGTALWISPWGNGWTWAWVNGGWHGITTSRLAVWSCQKAIAPTELVVGAGGAALRQRSTLDAAALQNLPAGARVTLSCSNGFLDADAARGPVVHALVAYGGRSGYIESARLAGVAGVPTGVYPASGQLRYAATPAIGRPGYRAAYTDSTFGTRVMRIADQSAFGTNKTELRQAYSKSQSWNSDGSLLMLGFSYPAPLLDGRTYQYLRTFPQPSYAVWSNVNPDVMYGTEGAYGFVRVNVRTGARTTLRTFTGYDTMSIGDGEGNLSNDDRYVALQARSGGNTTIIIYDMVANVVTGTKTFPGTGLNNSTMSPSGAYVVLNFEGAGGGVQVWSRNMTWIRTINDRGAHGDVGVDGAGNEVWVQSGADLPMWKLASGQRTSLLPAGTSVYNYAHISMRSIRRPGWVYVSHYAAPNGRPGSDQVAAVKTDGSGTVQVFAHAHHSIDQYHYQPHATPNRDGTRVLFASEWGIAGSPSYAYVAGASL